MQKSSTEAKSRSAGQRSPRLLWNPMVDINRVEKNLPLDLLLSQFNPVRLLLKIRLNIILLCALRYPNWSSLFTFSNWNFVRISCLPIRTTYPANLILFDL